MSVPVETENPPTKRQVWGAWATAGFGLVVFGAFLGTALLTILLFIIGNQASNTTLSLSQLLHKIISANEGLILAIATIASTAVCIPLIALFVKLRGSTSFAEYVGLRRLSIKTLLFWLAITLGIVALSGSIGFILKRPPDEFAIRLYATSAWPPILWIAIIIFAPAFEEILFRGFLFEGFRQSRIGTVATIVLMAVIWSLLHIQYGLFELTTIFIGGLVLGIARLKTNSLWSPLLMHAFFNLIAAVEISVLVFLGMGSISGAPAHGERIVLQADSSTFAYEHSYVEELMNATTVLIRTRLDELRVTKFDVERNGYNRISIRVPKNTDKAVLEAAIRPNILEFGELAGSNETARWENQLGRWKPATGIVDGERLAFSSEYFLGNASVRDKGNGEGILTYLCDTTGRQLSKQITTRLVGEPLAIFENGHALTDRQGKPIAPIVRGIINYKGSIDGLTLDEAKRLSTQIHVSRLLLGISVVERTEY